MECGNKSLTAKTILLVEDNPDHAELVRRMLEMQGIPNPIRHLSDGEMALKYLFRQHVFNEPLTCPRPCLVLLDLRLPKVDGLEVLKAVRDSEELQNLPVFILSTSETKEDVAQAYAFRANGYLVKPVDGHTFRQLIQSNGITELIGNHISSIRIGSSPSLMTG